MSKGQVSDRQLQPLVRAIERRESELRREIAEEGERAYEEGFSEIMDRTGDAADRAFARISAEIERERIDGHLAEIHLLEAARERLKSGAFGVCVGCGEQIDPARLRAFPAATRCVICQSRFEHARVVRY